MSCLYNIYFILFYAFISISKFIKLVYFRSTSIKYDLKCTRNTNNGQAFKSIAFIDFMLNASVNIISKAK